MSVIQPSVIFKYIFIDTQFFHFCDAKSMNLKRSG